MTEPDLLSYNRQVWDTAVRQGDQWTVPVSPEQVASARQGLVEIVLTPVQKVPADWLGPLQDREVLCLASGGGQQGPLLAAAGARVTVFDNSPLQLEQDQLVARRENLDIRTVQGDMRDLSAFATASFDLIVHPVSNCFVPDVKPVWNEAYRVLRPGGELLSGFIHPALYSYDLALWEQGIFQLKYAIPFSPLTSLSPEEFQRDYLDKGEALQFGHSLNDQIGGQLAAGFVLTGFYEDSWERWPVDRYFHHS
ncbi:MAG TPA: class I SAM-dependent methyltransferase, partial [Candidatus Obscuribacterales bacterium]